MKNLRYHRVLSTMRSALYLALLAALSWFLVGNPEARESIGAFGVSLLWIFILVSSVIVVARWTQQQKAPMIYPFLNATGDKENKEKYDALALNFSELLQLEIQRITHLLYIPESIAVHNPAFKKEQVPRPIITPAGPAALGSARAEDELGEMLKGIGALSFGPVSLPLGGLLYLLVLTLQGGGITGKIQKFGEKLSVVASYANRKYEAGSDALPVAEQGGEEAAKRLVRQIAYMISSDFADFPPSRWQSFREVIEGLEHYQRYLLSGKRNQSALEAAHRHFEQAAVEDNQYAWAYYNLGLLYEEQGNLDSAFEMYKQAVQSEPNLREAQFQLGKAYSQRGQLLNAVNAGRRTVKLAQKARKPFPVAHTFLGKWLYSLAYESRGDRAEALKYCNEALEHLKTAKKEYIRLTRQERRRADFSEQRLVGFRAGAIYSLKELSQAYKVLANLLETADQDKSFWRKLLAYARNILLGLSLQPGRDAYKKAEDALQQCLKLYPESSEAHAELGGFYMDRKDYLSAKEHLERAGGISPEDKSVVLELGATYLSPAIEDLIGLFREFRDNPRGWSVNWPEQRVNATQTQLMLAAFHYQTVIDLIRYQGEAGVEDQDRMIRALNGLAAVYGSQALIHCVRNLDCMLLIMDARRYLGKALVLNPFDAEVYDNLAGLYAIESEVKNFPPKAVSFYGGAADVAYPPEEAVPFQSESSASGGETLQQAYEMLRDYVREYGSTDPYSTTGVALALACSAPEQRANKELVSRFLEDRNLSLPSPDEVEASPVSQVYLWTAGWMLDAIGMPELGIQYLERAAKMGPFPEADLVDYDLGNVYLKLKKWNDAIERFQKMSSDDPYFWQSRMTLADALRENEAVDGDASGFFASLANLLPETTEGQNSIVPSSMDNGEMSNQDRYSLPGERLSAERVYGDAIAAAGNDPYRRATALAARADLFWSRKRYVEAISDCQESLKLAPAYAFPHRILALIYIDLFDYDRAIEEWERVGKLVQDMDEPHYHLGLGDAYASKADSTSNADDAETWRWRAVWEYQHAIQLFRANETMDKARTQTALGDNLMILKQFKEAEVAYLSALESSKDMPDEYRLHTKLAFVYVKRGLYGSAYSEYKKAIELCEEQLQRALKSGDTRAAGVLTGGLAYACNMLAYYLHAERGVNLEEGLAWVNRALEELERSSLDEALKRDHQGAYLDTRGWLYYRQGKYIEAKQDLERALSLTMGTVFEHGHLALTYERLAELSENDDERKRLQTMSREQWKLAFDLDEEGIWSAHKHERSGKTVEA